MSNYKSKARNATISGLGSFVVLSYALPAAMKDHVISHQLGYLAMYGVACMIAILFAIEADKAKKELA